jgi:DNA-binding IclR family transcriptional regulator
MPDADPSHHPMEIGRAEQLQIDGVAVPGAARALAVFEIFSRERRGLTKSELARLLGLSQSSTSDLLNTLHDLGFVTRTVTSRQFYPTGRLRRIANSIPRDSLATFGEEACGLLANRTKETACFAVRSGDLAEIVAAADGAHRLRYVVGAGDTVRLHTTSIGKAILSRLATDDRAKHLSAKPLERLTPNTKVDPEAIEHELVIGRRQGYFQATDEGTVGVSSLAVAGEVDDCIAGLSVIGPSQRIAERKHEILAQLLSVKDAIFDDSAAVD